MKLRFINKRRVVACLAVAFAAAAGGAWQEWTGYAAFDRKQGDNLLCRVDPTCRQLTANEVALAKDLYGDSIDYSRVKVFDRRYMGFLGKDKWMSPNSNIYNDIEDERSNDYAEQSWLAQSFMHEMGHVWQVQRGVDVRKQAIVAFFRHGFDYAAAYEYKITDHKRFTSFNLEQQANIFEDYNTARHLFRTMIAGKAMDKPHRHGASFNETARATCHMLELYEEKISQVLPLTPQTGCEAYHKPPPKQAQTPVIQRGLDV